MTMDSDRNDPMPQPTDRFEDGVGALEGESKLVADTGGHSMLTIEPARTANQDRAREMASSGRDGARVRDAGLNSKGGFFKRFGRS
jgi:hypothetical protein